MALRALLVASLLAASPAAAAAPAPHAMTATDGRRTVGRLSAITLEGKVVFKPADGGADVVRALEDTAVLELNESRRPPVAPPAEVWLPGGGTLLGAVSAAADGDLTFEGDLGRFALKLNGVRAVRFPANAPAAEENRRTYVEAFDRARADTVRNEDVLFARRGDDLVQLGGYLVGVADDGFRFRYQGNERRIGFAKVYAVVLSGRAAGGGGASPAVVANVFGAGGSTATVEVREMANDRWRLLGPAGLDVAVETRDIARVEFRSGKVVWLAGLARKDSAVKHVPALGGGWPVAVMDDRNFFGEPLRLAGREVRGLCVRPLTEIKYDLADYGGEFARFTAKVGIDDAAAPAGATADFEVLADGKSVFKAAGVGAVSADKPPAEVNLDLTGVKTLVLRVDFHGDRPAVGALAVWGDARLLRK